MRKKIAHTISRLMPMVFVFGCAVHPVTLEKELMIISEEKELTIGRRTDPYILQQYGYYDDPVLQRYIDRVGQKLVKVCRRRDIPYYFKILDSDEINAFALPGGYIYITRGILALLNSEAELAGVLGHEIGHVVGRDSANMISQQTLSQIVALAGMAAGPSASELAVAGSSLFNALMLGYGRQKEYLADSQGIEYMYQAGYDPLQMAKFQINLSEISQGPVGYAQYLSTHPDIFDRINRAEAQAKVAYAMHDAFSNHDNGGETSQKPSMKHSRALILADEYKVHLDGLAYGPRDRIRQIKIYTVRKGDTLQSIVENEMPGERELREIAFLNGMEIDAQLYPGQKIKVVY